MFDTLKSMLAKWDSIREINALSERDLSDLNLSRDQLLDFVQMPKDSPERLTTMAMLLGMEKDQLMADYPSYLERLHNCGHCSDRMACAATLAASRAVVPQDVPYCPNAAGIAQDLRAHIA